MVEVSPWFTDLQDLGPQYSVLGRGDTLLPEPPDVEVGLSTAIESGLRSTNYYLNHGFLTPAPGVSGDSFECAFQHAVAGEAGGQWWSVDLSFAPGEHGLDPNATPTCASISGGSFPPDFAGTSAGYLATNTDGPGDYLNGTGVSCGIGFHLAPWLSLYGPSAGLPDPIPPDGAVLEWEFDTPDWVDFEAAGDEDPGVTQTCIPGSPVAWRLPGGGLYVDYDPIDDEWTWHTGGPPAGTVLALFDGTPGAWNSIAGTVDLDNPSPTGFDFIASGHTGLGAAPSCAKPGTYDAVRLSQWLALRVSMLPRRYRWVYTRQPATRQYPRDDTRGLIGGGRVYPPPRGNRVAGGRHL